MDVNIGIDQAQRQEISDSLSKVQADTYALYQKTHYFHWNVTGPQFQTLHLMFEEHYNELWLAVDVIAERVRALGFFAPGTSKQYGALASIKEEDGVPPAPEMIKKLVEGHEAVARTSRAAYTVAEKTNDQPTCDLLTQRMQIAEKTAWMLRSLLA